ncbi:MAG: hypothetical protein K6A14_00250 [Erysipelotrichaceae bacterium]|nr:hypothetical protein [Erysipelotrichaceae bacterium]
MKYSWEFKLECVEKYMKQGVYPKPEVFTGNQHSFVDKLELWTKIYKQHGIEGLKHNAINKEWTTEKRFELVAQVLAGN